MKRWNTVTVFAGLLALGLGQNPVVAADQTFSQQALTQVLNGHSIKGLWGKQAAPYTQYFDERGSTSYRRTAVGSASGRGGLIIKGSIAPYGHHPRQKSVTVWSKAPRTTSSFG